MSLFRVVYYISIYLLAFNYASDIQRIQIHGPQPDFSSYTVLHRKPLEVVLENFSAVLKCTYKDFRNYKYSYYNYFKAGYFKIIISEVKALMSTRWQCEVVDFNNTHINYSFDIRVKGSKTVNVKIGKFHEVYENTNLTVQGYDGIAQHDFEEGDIVDLTCANSYGTGQIRMQYYGEDGKIVFDTRDNGTRYPLTFRILVKAKSVNQSYMECTYIAPTTLQEFTYRTVLTVLPNKNIRHGNDFVVTVNDMELTPFPRKVHGRDRYLYYYIVGESVQLTCAKKNQMMLSDIYGNFLNGNTKTVVTKDIKNTTSMYSISIETTHLDGMTFQCYSKSESSNNTVDILFLKEHAEDPVIRGLQAKNILYQFNTGDNDWIIYYQHSRKQVLNLTCITAINREPRWVHKANITSIVNENKKYNTKYINYVFNMEAELTETISCESTKSETVSERRMIIFVILKDDETNKCDFNLFLIVTEYCYNMGGYAEFDVVGISVKAVRTVTIVVVILIYYWIWKRNVANKGIVPNVRFDGADTLIAEFK